MNYAGNHRFLLTQNCNCYPLLLQKCSTIKNSQLSSRSSLKDLSVALLFITFHTLFSFQGAIVVYTNSISLAATQALLLAHFVVSPLRFTNASLVCESSQNLTILILLRPDANVQSLERFHLFSKAIGLLLSLVEIVGIEPATSCLQGRRSPS